MDRVDLLLSQPGLVYGHAPVSQIKKRLEKARKEKRPIRLIYGETFDEGGNPVDILKYYFYISAFSSAIELDYGIKAEATLLIADHSVYETDAKRAKKLVSAAKSRYDFAEKVKRTFNCNFDVKRMSALFGTKAFKAEFEKINRMSKSNKSVMKLIEKTVPADRLEEEKKRGFRYSIEEIATIKGFDFKIGPPREELYDKAANFVFKKMKELELLPIYLTPVYPLGTTFIHVAKSNTVRHYGLVPYRANSQGMAGNRIVVGKTPLERAKTLIEKTKIPKAKGKANPVMDIAIIGEMAKQHTMGEIAKVDVYDRFYKRKMSERQLKDLAFGDLYSYIMKPLG